MLEIFALIFLTRKIGVLAIKKGQAPRQWKLYIIVAWIIAEFLGIIIGQELFGKEIVLGLLLFALVFAFGSYLLIDYTLRQKPDVHDDDDIKNIGTYL